MRFYEELKEKIFEKIKNKGSKHISPNEYLDFLVNETFQNGEKIENQDVISAMEQLQEEGFLEIVQKGLQPSYVLTEKGWNTICGKTNTNRRY